MNSENKYLKKLIREQLNTLSYDEMDLDSFTNQYLVGRWFENEETAIDYLKQVIDKSNGKTINDFIVKKNDKDTSLKPFKIYPKPTKIQLNRNQASLYIKKHGILSSPDLKYVTYPLYAYVEYKFIDKLKELGVKFTFKPIKQINLNPVLERFFRENNFGSVIISGDNKLKLYSLPSEMDTNYIKELKQKTEGVLNKFNNLVGTDYFIKSTFATKTRQSTISSLLNTLDSAKYNPNKEFEIKYSSVSFLLNRGVDEEEYLAVVSMSTPEKPEMIS